MIITRNIQKYLAFAEDSVIDTLKKIDKNNAGVVFVVAEDSTLKGVVSDGDVRRWLVEKATPDLSLAVGKMMKKSVRSLPLGTDPRRIALMFNRGVECVPLLDERNRIVSLAFQKSLSIDIDGREISDRVPSFIIAEIGNNHQGDMNLAKKLVDCAVEAGADCAKFQMRDTSSLYVSAESGSDLSDDLGTQYTLDLLSRFQLSNAELLELFKYCRARNIIPLCTPWDLNSLDYLESCGLGAYKIASADFTNHQLLEAAARTGKPLICSTGMCSEQEVFESVKLLRSLAANFVLLHCNSTYPAPYKDINLNYMSRLSEMCEAPVGYSGHERGIEVPIAAISMGAVVIEKHLTVDRNLEGADHKVSLLPDEFASMVSSIRNVEAALGSKNTHREISQGEMINRETLAKSLVAAKDIAVGEVITRDLVDIKSPGKGLQPNSIGLLVGRKAKRAFQAGDFFFGADIHGANTKKDSYLFSRPYGVPVRYHDFLALSKNCKMDLLEFHMSYKDVREAPDDYFSEKTEMSLVVHSPELFENDHIVDLASFDSAYVDMSIRHVQSVIDATKKLAPYFSQKSKPIVVLNAGGWDRKGFLPESEVAKKYHILSDSLKKIDFSSIELAIQTMPPFPWHFGGQSHHNLFVQADQIVNFCQTNQNVKVCLDISHSMMACNYYGWDVYTFIKKVAPYVVHLHIADAEGVDGEGVEMGLGDIDFAELSVALNTYMPKVGFIPEIWQGHKNNGEGFWQALGFLEAAGF